MGQPPHGDDQRQTHRKRPPRSTTHSPKTADLRALKGKTRGVEQTPPNGLARCLAELAQSGPHQRLGLPRVNSPKRRGRAESLPWQVKCEAKRSQRRQGSIAHQGRDGNAGSMHSTRARPARETRKTGMEGNVKIGNRWRYDGNGKGARA